MKTIHLTPDTQLTDGCVATIGFFDGVHRGHQYLLQQVTTEAQRAGLSSVAITFDRHPREVLHPDNHPELLSTLSTKLLLLSRTNVDTTVVLPFDRKMASLSARDFMLHILKEQLNVHKLIIGYDHRFGHNRSEGFDEYVVFGHEMGIEVIQSLPLDIEGVRVSSSVVRQFIKEGNIEAANNCLGYPYTVDGTVEHGYQEGRRMGFPTANLNVEGTGQLLPQPGVYAVWARPEGQIQMFHAMMNIGTRPTFDGHRQTQEVNIFQYKGSLYGQRLLVSFAERIREERRFDSPAELAGQLRQDKATIEQYFENHAE